VELVSPTSAKVSVTTQPAASVSATAVGTTAPTPVSTQSVGFPVVRAQVSSVESTVIEVEETLVTTVSPGSASNAYTSCTGMEMRMMDKETPIIQDYFSSFLDHTFFQLSHMVLLFK